jgi:ribosomal protein S18 acetylase RimI-like enzyme
MRSTHAAGASVHFEEAIRRLQPEDRLHLRQFWVEHWGGETMVCHGTLYRTNELDGFVLEQDGDWIGLVTFFISGDDCELLSLDSLSEGEGIGTALLEEVLKEARQRGCRCLTLTTTNDNLRALGFYQKRGFELVALRRGAVEAARKLKTSIPLVGEGGIPLRDEIDLEFPLT